MNSSDQQTCQTLSRTTAILAMVWHQTFRFKSIRINSIQSFRSNFWKPEAGMAEYHIYVTWNSEMRGDGSESAGHAPHWAYLGMGFTVTICDSLGIPTLQHWSDPTLLQDFAEFGSRPGATRAKDVPDWEKPFPSNGPMMPNGKYRQVRPSPFWFGKIRQCNPDLVPVSPNVPKARLMLHPSSYWNFTIGTVLLFSQPRYEPYRPPSHRESAVDLADFWRYPGSTSFGVNYLFDVQVFVWTVVAAHATDLLLDVSWKVRDVRWC